MGGKKIYKPATGSRLKNIRHSNSSKEDSERLFLAAILWQAWRDLSSKSKENSEQLRREALDWFERGVWCENICELLGVSVVELRERVRERVPDRKETDEDLRIVRLSRR